MFTKILYPFVKGYIRHLHRRNCVYRRLHCGEDPFRLHDLQHELECTFPTALPNSVFARHYGGSVEVADVYHSLMIRLLAGRKIFRPALKNALLTNTSLGIRCPIPNYWTKTVNSFGITVNTNLVAIARATLGSYFILKSVGCLIRLLYNVSDTPLGKASIYCADIDSNIARTAKVNYESGNVSNDYLCYVFRLFGNSTGSVCVDAKGIVDKPDWVVGVRYPFYLNQNLLSKAKLIGWYACALPIALASLLSRNIHFAYVLEEALLLKAFKLAQVGSNPSTFIFTISSLRYRPMWTYEAEKRGGRVLMLNYAASYPGFKYKGRYPPPELGVRTIAWPEFHILNSQYSKWIQSISHPLTKVVELDVAPKMHQGLRDCTFTNSQRDILIFDVTPFRLSENSRTMPIPLYRTPGCALAFLTDIISIANQADRKVFLKPKRKEGANSHSKGYWKWLSILSDSGQLNIIDAGIDSERVIKHFSIVISAPFTSTGLEAKRLGRLSYYYDPRSLLSRDDRAAQSVPIVLGKEELASVFRRLEFSP